MKNIFFIVLLVSLATLFCKATDKKITIFGQAYFLKNGDSVELVVYKHGIIRNDKFFADVKFACVHNGQFKFNIVPRGFPQYIVLHFAQQPQRSLVNYIVEDGENLNIIIDSNHIKCSGTKSAAFELQYQMRKIELDFLRRNHVSDLTAATLNHYYSVLDSITSTQNSYLDHNSKGINQNMIAFLKSNNYYAGNSAKYSMLNLTIRIPADSNDSKLIRAYHRYQKNELKKPYAMDKWNTYFLSYTREKYKVDSCVARNLPFSLDHYLSYIIRNYEGLSRQELLLDGILEESDFTLQSIKPIHSSLPFILNADCRNYIQNILDNRMEGSDAYNFSLTDANGKVVKLADFKGDVVVLDFWFTGCGNCMRLKPYLDKVEQDFAGKNVRFITVCLDKSRSMFLNSLNGGKYTSANTCNLYTNGNGFQDITAQKYQVDSCPMILVITKQGKVKNIQTDPRSDNGVELTEILNSSLH